MAGMLWSSDVHGLCLLSMQVVAHGPDLPHVCVLCFRAAVALEASAICHVTLCGFSGLPGFHVIGVLQLGRPREGCLVSMSELWEHGWRVCKAGKELPCEGGMPVPAPYRRAACWASEPVRLHRASAGEAVAHFFWHDLW